MRELHLDMDQCGRLPLPRVWEIFRYFQTSPPLHLLVRDFVGYKAPEAIEDSAYATPAGLEGAPRVKEIPAHLRQDLDRIKAAHAR